MNDRAAASHCAGFEPLQLLSSFALPSTDRFSTLRCRHPLDHPMLNNPYLVALGIPLLLLLCGAVAKKLARRDDWRRSDFFLGLELALADIGAGLVYLYDLQRMNMNHALDTATLGIKIGTTATFLVIAFGGLLWVLSIHQDWEQHAASAKGLIWLGVVSNAVGIILFAVFVLFVKGV
ncbi:hypothetical protein [Pseudoduganella rhizocola]|uniref:hypothetical protein n=1 Tax=Pseudoduganella rhizocola TaxID=3382643 RepID=UPI0038B589E7